MWVKRALVGEISRNDEQSHIYVAHSSSKDKSKSLNPTLRLFNNAPDDLQFAQITEAMMKSPLVDKYKMAESLVNIIAECSMGSKVKCCNQECNKQFWALYADQNNTNEHEFGHNAFVCNTWLWNGYLCAECFDLITHLTLVPSINLELAMFIQRLSNIGIRSLEDLLSYERKKYILLHQFIFSEDQIKHLFAVIYGFNDWSRYNELEDDGVLIWDVDTNISNISELRELSIERRIEMFQSLQLHLPAIRRQVYPKQLDLTTFSARDGSLMFEICKTDNLDLIKHFIEIERMNPHYQFPIGINVLHSMSCTNTISSLQYLVSYGLDMDLRYHHGSTFLTFLVERLKDDVYKNGNAELILSFGFEMEDEHVQHMMKGCVDIVERFEAVQLLKPVDFMKRNVLINVKQLLHQVIKRESDVRDPWLSDHVFEYFDVRSVCRLYQYTVQMNDWHRKSRCDFLF